MNKKIDHYQILGISPTSSKKDIRDSFRELVLKNHPQKNNFSKESKEKFQEIQESFKILSDEEVTESSFFPNDRNKLIRLKTLTNKLGDLDAKEEEEKEKEENELFKTNGKKFFLEELKTNFLKIYKSGPSTTKYHLWELHRMSTLLELIEDKELNKKLDSTFQNYKNELESKVLKNLHPWQGRVGEWICLGNSVEEKTARLNYINNDIRDKKLEEIKSALEEIEKIRSLSPLEENELKRIKEFNENDLIPIDLDEKDREEEVDISSLSKQNLIALIEKIKREIQELKVNKNKNSSQQGELAAKEQKLNSLEKGLGKFNTNQENSPKTNNDQWKDNLKTIGLIGLVIVVVILIIGFIRSRTKSN